ncbi:hypothetical protein J2X14_003377 [Pantoea alhagi]|uniref:DUF3289 family protein n=1 Tax=Mixta sp. BE291 TaxID=3158787 RepID=UPI00285C504F|nr:hypothetical protein [Pantoea alhagi]
MTENSASPAIELPCLLFAGDLNRINGLDITVHDIWAMHISLDFFEVKNENSIANIRFKFQDHFGLQSATISNTLIVY